MMYVPNKLLVFLHSTADRPALKSSVRHDEQRDSGTRRDYEPYKILRLIQNVTQYRLLN